MVVPSYQHVDKTDKLHEIFSQNVLSPFYWKPLRSHKWRSCSCHFVHSLIVDFIRLCQSSGFRNMCNAYSHIENKNKFCTTLTTQENILTLLIPLFKVSQIEILCGYFRQLTCLADWTRRFRSTTLLSSIWTALQKSESLLGFRHLMGPVYTHCMLSFSENEILNESVW